jgi:hypothetical protein
MSHPPHQHRDAIIAWANGAPIQRRRFGDQKWIDCAQSGLLQPSWSANFEYRPKPDDESPPPEGKAP